MKYDFDNAKNRSRDNSIKWNAEAIKSITGVADAEPFWVADMDYECMDEIVKAAGKVAESKIYGYPAFGRIEEYARQWIERRHGWKVGEDKISFASGLLHGIASGVRLFSKPGDRILVPCPCYKPFRKVTANNDRKLVEYPLSYDSGMFSLDLERFLKEMESIDMVLFCSPHNPSGIVFSESELASILKKAKELDITVISDEIHGDLVHPGKRHVPMGKIAEEIGAKCVTYMAPSKTFNIAGEHCAVAIFSQKWMKDAFDKEEEALFLTEPGHFVGELFIKAYEKGDEYNSELTSYLKGNRDAITSFLDEHLPEVKLSNAEASFVAFLDMSAYYGKIKKVVEEKSDEFPPAPEGGVLSRFFGVRAKVAMNDGTWFGKGYPSFLRFNYGTDRKRIIKALERIEKAIKAL